MALNLDARQRAMLQDMGITLWVPATQPAAPAVASAPASVPALASASAPVTAATPAVPVTAVASVAAEAMVVAPPVSADPAPATPSPTTEASASNPQAEPTVPAQTDPASEASTAHATPVYRAPAAASAPWFMAPVVHAYADTVSDDNADAGWLVLVECADPLDPWAGDAGALLNQMLRALRLHHHPRVRIAPLTRQAPDSVADGPLQPLAPALQAALGEHRPARVLLMGLHAARAVLGRSEALGPLRAIPHALHQVPTVVTYDPAYLLRAPHAKPGAWADLCRAHALQPPTA